MESENWKIIEINSELEKLLKTFFYKNVDILIFPNYFEINNNKYYFTNSLFEMLRYF